MQTMKTNYMSDEALADLREVLEDGPYEVPVGFQDTMYQSL